MKNNILKESNPITTKLSDSLNDFLMDMAQGYVDGLTYNMISDHEYSEEDIRKLRNMKRRCDYYYGDEDYIVEKIVPQIKKLFGISENLDEKRSLREAGLSLPESLSWFLEDLAQAYVDGLEYSTILHHKYSVEDLKKLRNLKRRCDYHDNDEDYIIEKIVPEIKKIFGISESLKESTPLANRFVAWYDDFSNHERSYPLNSYLKRSEEIFKKYLGSKMYEMYIDEAVDALPLEGKAEIYDFLNQVEMLDE